MLLVIIKKFIQYKNNIIENNIYKEKNNNNRK